MTVWETIVEYGVEPNDHVSLGLFRSLELAAGAIHSGAHFDAERIVIRPREVGE